MLKRTFDIIVSAFALIVLSPLLMAIALLALMLIGRPVLFRQERPGLYGEPFTMLKFRTMTDARDSSGALLPDEARLGRFGRFLRATSIDELPELWNVLRGDMSLVGPRPLLMEYLPLYTPEQARRHQARPGITGWAQVNGRNAISWDEKFALDLWYVDNQNFVLDLHILALTALRVVRARGINEAGKVGQTKFGG